MSFLSVSHNELLLPRRGRHSLTASNKRMPSEESMECSNILASSSHHSSSHHSALLAGSTGCSSSHSYGVKESTECDIMASSAVNSGSSGSKSDHSSSSGSVSSSSIIDLLAAGTKERVWMVALCTFVVCLASLLNGMMLGFSSPALMQLQYNVSEEHRISQKDIKFSLFPSLCLIGALFGSLLAWPTSEYLGRKVSLILSGIPAAVGWLMIALAHLAAQSNTFYGVLLTGRLLTGIFYGWTSVCVPLYILEIASTKLKGLFGSCHQFFITVGIFLSYFLGIEYKQSDGKYFSIKYWQIALIAIGIVVIYEFLTLLIYESPRWLLSKQKEQKAFLALKGLRGPNFHISDEIEHIKATFQHSYSILEQLKEFRQRSVIIPFLLVVMLLIYESGVYIPLFYAAQIFVEAGFGERHVNLISTIAIGAVQMVATLLSVVFVDCLGRKFLLTLSATGVALGSLVLGVYFHVYDNVCESCLVGETTCSNNSVLNDTVHQYFPCNTTQFGYLAITCIVVLIVSFSLGLGPIPWIALPELMPNHVRTLAGSFAVMINWITNFTITFTFKLYSRPPVNNDGAWWTFSLVMFSAIFVVILFLPETKGRSLEEIQEHFEQGRIFAISCNSCLRDKHLIADRRTLAQLATPTTSYTESNLNHQSS